MYAPSYTNVRAQLERHGGTVEKFIGDAVMALFGAPTTHEDDPERAVRAALAIRDYGHLKRADELYGEVSRLEARLGDEASIRFHSAVRLWFDWVRGRWDKALEAADAFIAQCETGSPHTNEWNVRAVRGSIREARADAEGALADHLRGVAAAREMKNPRYLVEALANCAATHAGRGERDRAQRMLDEAISLVREYGMASGLATCGLFAEQLGVTGHTGAGERPSCWCSPANYVARPTVSRPWEVQRSRPGSGSTPARASSVWGAARKVRPSCEGH